MTKVTLAELNTGSDSAFGQHLGGIFEHAPWVAAGAAVRRPFASLADLFGAMRDVVLRADREVRLGLLRGHPALAGLAARSGNMTAESVAEQGSAGLDAMGEARAREFDALNAAYEARFGFPFIICVRRHGADSILREFRRRVAQAPETEFETALSEVFRIAGLRVADAVAAPDVLPVFGRLSTHVLDNAAGRPAAGVAVELLEIPAEGMPRTIVRAVTNADGRTDAPLMAGRPLPIGTYELRFALGDHYRAAGTALAEPPFLDIVPIRFAIAEPEGHYHVPLAATPWSYSTYRGS